MPSTSRFFDGYARDFDAIYGNTNTPLNALVNRTLRKSMRLRFESTMAGCSPIDGMSVVDIGCGPGHFGVSLAKRGARSVLGLDFAESMIALAEQHADAACVRGRCRFVCGDFMTTPINETFDYAVVMGVMDYVKDPRAMIARVAAMTTKRAFFSFPVDGGFLAWQRKLRYRSRCELYMYTLEQLRELFEGTGVRVQFEKLARDYFVTVHMA